MPARTHLLHMRDRAPGGRVDAGENVAAAAPLAAREDAAVFRLDAKFLEERQLLGKQGGPTSLGRAHRRRHVDVRRGAGGADGARARAQHGRGRGAQQAQPA